MLEFSHNHWLVLASLMVAMMAGFTGLSLLKGASGLSLQNRKINISLAAVAMGGGIWSMHFVAMLGLRLPVPFFYDMLTTLLSALIAILVVGLALLILHFRDRDRATTIAAGALVGTGILAMHYLGMSGIRLVQPVYTAGGVSFAILVSVGLCVTTFVIAYSQRAHRNIVMGTVGFGIAVFAVHFVAMTGTQFRSPESAISSGMPITNETLAIGVALTTFAICGAFLLTSATFFTDPQNVADAELSANGVAGSTSIAVQTAPGENGVLRIPYEKDNRTFFVEHSQIAAIRAEGHYSFLYLKTEKLFCPWPISQVHKRLAGSDFIQVHRSYLVNPDHVSAFERRKDNGICLFEHFSSLEKVPVSRSRLSDVRAALGLD